MLCFACYLTNAPWLNKGDRIICFFSPLDLFAQSSSIPTFSFLCTLLFLLLLFTLPCRLFTFALCLFILSPFCFLLLFLFLLAAFLLFLLLLLGLLYLLLLRLSPFGVRLGVHGWLVHRLLQPLGLYAPGFYPHARPADQADEDGHAHDGGQHEAIYAVPGRRPAAGGGPRVGGVEHREGEELADQGPLNGQEQRGPGQYGGEEADGVAEVGAGLGGGLLGPLEAPVDGAQEGDEDGAVAKLDGLEEVQPVLGRVVGDDEDVGGARTARPAGAQAPREVDRGQRSG